MEHDDVCWGFQWDSTRRRYCCVPLGQDHMATPVGDWDGDRVTWDRLDTWSWRCGRARDGVLLVPRGVDVDLPVFIQRESTAVLDSSTVEVIQFQFFDVWVVPQLQFIVMEQRQVPRGRWFAGQGCATKGFVARGAQYIDKVVDVPVDVGCSMEACGRISHIFFARAQFRRSPPPRSPARSTTASTTTTACPSSVGAAGSARRAAAARTGTAAHRRADHRNLRAPSKFSMILCGGPADDVPSSVEQVIAVPEISCPSRPLRVAVVDKQMADLLMDVPTPSFHEANPRWWRRVILARYLDADGYEWRTGSLLVEVGHTYHPVGPLEGASQLRAVNKCWARLR